MHRLQKMVTIMAMALPLIIEPTFAGDVATPCLLQAAQKIRQGKKITIIKADSGKVKCHFDGIDEKNRTINLLSYASMRSIPTEINLSVDDIIRIEYRGDLNPFYIPAGILIGGVIGIVVALPFSDNRGPNLTCIGIYAASIGTGTIGGITLAIRSRQMHIIECP